MSDSPDKSIASAMLAISDLFGARYNGERLSAGRAGALLGQVAKGLTADPTNTRRYIESGDKSARLIAKTLQEIPEVTMTMSYVDLEGTTTVLNALRDAGHEVASPDEVRAGMELFEAATKFDRDQGPDGGLPGGLTG